MGFFVIATWVAKEGEADNVRAILDEVTPGNRAEPKSISFHATVSTDEPNTFLLVEHYTDESGYHDHRATESFRIHVLGDAINRLASRSVATFTTITE